MIPPELKTISDLLNGTIHKNHIDDRIYYIQLPLDIDIAPVVITTIKPNLNEYRIVEISSNNKFQVIAFAVSKKATA